MGTTDYCFSFFRKPIQNIEPIRAVGIVDVYRYVIGHYAQPQTESLRSMLSSPESKRYKATHFDYCTFSGLFRKRNEKELIMHSGLMCLDFDHVEKKDFGGSYHILSFAGHNTMLVKGTISSRSPDTIYIQS